MNGIEVEVWIAGYFEYTCTMIDLSFNSYESWTMAAFNGIVSLSGERNPRQVGFSLGTASILLQKNIQSVFYKASKSTITNSESITIFSDFSFNSLLNLQRDLVILIYWKCACMLVFMKYKLYMQWMIYNKWLCGSVLRLLWNLMPENNQYICSMLSPLIS